MSDAAYVVMALHASKYFGMVTGLLIGRVDGETVRVEEVLPIAHSDLTIWTTPLTQMSLYLTEEHAKQKDYQIIGMYFANDVPTDQSIPTPPTRIGDRIHQYFPYPVLLRIEAERLTPERRKSTHCTRVFAKPQQDGSWGRASRPDATLQVSQRALSITDNILTAAFSVSSMVVNGLDPYQVSDFEDHCLDPRCDWYNSNIINLINGMTA